MSFTAAAEPKSAADLLHAWLQVRLEEPALQWLGDRIKQSDNERDLYIAISLVPRKVGKGDLNLNPEELAAAQKYRPGWNPSDWTLDQAARLYLLIEGSPGELFHSRLSKLFATADVGEQVALYQGLPIFPDPERHVGRAAEGIRSNIKAVLTAVAHHNPYPADHLDEAAWNQMILKAVFVGIPLYPIQGIDRRKNIDLARMLCDFAKERWAAGRTVTPELWRCVGRFAEDPDIGHVLKQAIEKGSEIDGQAVTWSMMMSIPAAKEVLPPESMTALGLKDADSFWASIYEKATA